MKNQPEYHPKYQQEYAQNNNKKTISVIIDKDMEKELKHIAIDKDIKFSEIVREALQNYVNECKGE